MKSVVNVYVLTDDISGLYFIAKFLYSIIKQYLSYDVTVIQWKRRVS